MESINLQVRVNPTFKRLHEQVKKLYSSIDYTSSSSCKEFLHVLADRIRCEMKHDVKEAGFYAILADECKDDANYEELGICIRYMNPRENKIQERFSKIVCLPNSDAAHVERKHASNAERN